MTRRILVFNDNSKYYVSQEFNGDKEEFIRFHGHSFVPVNWEDVVPLFNDVETLPQFRKVIKTAEGMYGYEKCPLNIKDEVPRCEEVWMLIDGKLQLYARYDDVVTR